MGPSILVMRHDLGRPAMVVPVTTLSDGGVSWPGGRRLSPRWMSGCGRRDGLVTPPVGHRQQALDL